MKQVGGFWLPDTEVHFVSMMERIAPRLGTGMPDDDGRASYQGHKWWDALMRFDGRRTFVDIGAHCALWSWFLAHHFDHVVAFEPVALHADLFRKNMGDLPYTLHQVALGDSAGEIRIEGPADQTGAFHVGDAGGTRTGHGALLSETVGIKRLDDFDFDAIDFLKIDVEGYELPVVRGGEKTLKQHKPWVIVEQKGNDSYYGHAPNAARDLLVEWGWQVESEITGDVLLKWAGATS